MLGRRRRLANGAGSPAASSATSANTATSANPSTPQSQPEQQGHTNTSKDSNEGGSPNGSPENNGGSPLVDMSDRSRALASGMMSGGGGSCLFGTNTDPSSGGGDNAKGQGKGRDMAGSAVVEAAAPSNANASTNNCRAPPPPPAIPNEGGPPYASLALSLCSQAWPDLGLDLDLLNDPTCTGTSTSTSISTSTEEKDQGTRAVGVTPPSSATDDIYPIVDRIVSLLLVRIVALVNTTTTTTCTTTRTTSDGAGGQDAEQKEEELVDYPDLSTSTIARYELDRCASSSDAAASSDASVWPQPSITPIVIAQLRDYVYKICSDYRAVHYHNVEHCYHVTLSANKLMDMLLCEQEEEEEEEDGDEGEDNGTSPGQAVAATPAFRERQRRRRRQNGNKNDTAKHRHQRRRKLYGLRTDTLTHLAFLFSALIHDVDHTGITNRQLVEEADELALLYNDQSVAEQRSLAIAFSTLLLPEFDQLREVMFATRKDYQRFRKVVINLVLTTDIASPERTQIVKSKWKEAFPSAAHAARAEQREEQRRRSSMAASSAISSAIHRQSVGGGAPIGSPPQIAERVGEEGEEEEEGEEDEEAKVPKEGPEPSLLANLRKKAADEAADVPADALGESGATFTAPLKGYEDEDVMDNEGARKPRVSAPPSALRRSKRNSDSSARVSIVDPLQEGQEFPPLRRGDSNASIRSDGSASYPGDLIHGADETPQQPPESLKSSFFRGRVSMGLGYMKGETDSVSHRNIEINKETKESINTRMSLMVQPGGPPLLTEQQRLSLAEGSSSFHDDEEEDEISSDGGSSVSTSASSPSVEGDEGGGMGGSNYALNAEDGEIVSGVTLSKLDIEKGDTFDPSTSPRSNFRLKSHPGAEPQSNQRRLHPSIKNAMDESNAGMRGGGGSWMRAASDRRLLTSSAPQGRVRSLRKGSAGAGRGGDRRAQMVRRYSLPNLSKAPKYELRLGIRRAVDLTGQPIETYAPRAAIKRAPSRDALDVLGEIADEEFEEEEYDELKVSAILEHLIKASDVAALLQGWDNLNKWSSRLYREQKASAIVARGDDPEASWFEGQIVFMDIYIMPLAKKLAEPGIFDDETGSMFAQCVSDNRARWLIEGRLKTDKLIADWNEKHMEDS